MRQSVFRRKAEKRLGKTGARGEFADAKPAFRQQRRRAHRQDACATKGEEKRANLSERPGPQKPRKIGHYAERQAQRRKKKEAGGTPFPGQAGVTKKARRKKKQIPNAPENSGFG